MPRRVLWAVLVVVMLVVTGMVARQDSAALWRGVMHEEPPAESI
jgi:hypothetical protein